MLANANFRFISSLGVVLILFGFMWMVYYFEVPTFDYIDPFSVLSVFRKLWKM